MLERRKIELMPPLHLAFIGDSVYALMVKEHLLQSGEKLSILHKEATKRVRAGYQAQALRLLMPVLSHEEAEFARKGRNAHARHQAPKSATTQEYQMATAFETLIGYLHVSGQTERLRALFSYLMDNEGRMDHAQGHIEG